MDLLTLILKVTNPGQEIRTLEVGLTLCHRLPSSSLWAGGQYYPNSKREWRLRQVTSPTGDPQASLGCVILFLFRLLPTLLVSSYVWPWHHLSCEIKGRICLTPVGMTEGGRVSCHPQWGQHGASCSGHWQRIAGLRSLFWKSFVVVTTGYGE